MGFEYGETNVTEGDTLDLKLRRREGEGVVMSSYYRPQVAFAWTFARNAGAGVAYDSREESGETRAREASPGRDSRARGSERAGVSRSPSRRRVEVSFR